MPVDSPPAGATGLRYGTSQGLQGNALQALHSPICQALHHNHALLAVNQLEPCTQGMCGLVWLSVV